MSYLTWSTNANLNVTIDGINIAEGCPPANINNAIRAVMAGTASLRDAVPSIAGLAPLASPAFTGTPTVSGRGAIYHNANSANTSGRITFLPEGSGLPSSPVNGDIVFFFS